MSSTVLQAVLVSGELFTGLGSTFPYCAQKRLIWEKLILQFKSLNGKGHGLFESVEFSVHIYS